MSRPPVIAVHVHIEEAQRHNVRLVVADIRADVKGWNGSGRRVAKGFTVVENLKRREGDAEARGRP